MSEPCSFLLKVKITKPQWERFLAAQPLKPVMDDNWKNWWRSRSMYGWSELETQDFDCYGFETNRAMVEYWVKNEEPFDLDPGAFSHYDPEQEIWNFGMIFFEENYGLIIPMIAFIKSLADYVKDPTEGFAIVYNYVWGDEDRNCLVMALITFIDKLAIIDEKIFEIKEVPKFIRQYCDDYLKNEFYIYNEKYKLF